MLTSMHRRRRRRAEGGEEKENDNFNKITTAEFKITVGHQPISNHNCSFLSTCKHTQSLFRILDRLPYSRNLLREEIFANLTILLSEEIFAIFEFNC